METNFTFRPSLRTIATRFLILMWKTAQSIKRKSHYISWERGKLKQRQRVSCDRFSACAHTQCTFEYFATRTHLCVLSKFQVHLQLCYMHVVPHIITCSFITILYIFTYLYIFVNKQRQRGRKVGNTYKDAIAHHKFLRASHEHRAFHIPLLMQIAHTANRTHASVNAGVQANSQLTL